VTVVRAAGGLVVRLAAEETAEVLVVHRRRYGDWSFPKGKLHPGETEEACALREVEEETGVRCELVEELPSTAYVDSQGRPKRVRYWLMRPVGGEPRPTPPEVDEVRWAGIDEARRLLTYDRDVELLRGLAGR
jgi:8-oxo-dGTP diphosphatase